MKTAKIFAHGSSQAVRLPKEFHFDDDEVIIKHHAGGVLLLPRKYAVNDLMQVLALFKSPIQRGENPPPEHREF